MTIAERVLTARRKLGLRRLAQRAACPPGMVVGVSLGVIAFDAGPLRRLLETATAVAGTEARPR
jgi:hypothetical protein